MASLMLDEFGECTTEEKSSINVSIGGDVLIDA